MSAQAWIPARPGRAALPLTVGAAVALLAGCSYRMDRVENPVQMPVAWDFQEATGSTATIQKQWWENFGSQILNGLIQEAQQANPSLIQLEERLKQAERTLSQNRDNLLPDLRLSTGLNKSYSGGNQVEESSRESTSSLALSSSHNVDLWGASAASFRAQVANYIGTQYDAEMTRIQTAAQVTRAYFSLLSVRTNVAIARENLAIAERLLRIFEARYENGVSRAFDLAQQTTQVLQQRAQLITSENQMRQTETALGILLGYTPQDFHLEGEPIEQLQVPEIAPWAPSELLLRRPDIAAAETDMAAAKANLAAARARLIPVTLSLSANGSQTGSPTELISLTDARTYSLSGALAIAESIFSFRQKRNSVLNAESAEYLALISYAQTIRSALKEIDDALATANTNRRTEEIQQQTLANSQRALELAELEYREGSANLQEVLDAQRSLFSAQNSIAQARLARLNSAVALYQALGGGWVPPAQ